MIPENLTFHLFGNPDKTNDMQPDLIGSFALDGKTYDVASWVRTTMNLQRQYHSVSIHDAEKRRTAKVHSTKCEPVAKAKLYELRKRLETDPDFFSRESFNLAGINWYPSLLVRLNDDPDDLEAMSFELTLARQPIHQAPTPEALRSMMELRDRLVEREKQRQAKAAGDSGPDEIPF